MVEVSEVGRRTEAASEAIRKHNEARAKVRDPEPNPATPQLKGTIEMQVSIEQDINFLAYFQQLSERERARYADLDLSGGYEEWERPMMYLLGDENDAPTTSPVPWVDGATWHERADVDESKLRVNYRTGSQGRHFGEWSPEDFETLRANVPWLDQVHLALENEDPDERDEELARIPGPLDTPLEGV